MKKHVLVLIALFIAVFSIKTIAFGKTEPEYKVFYESVEIKNGDSLWEIASKHQNDLYTTKQYVYIIMDFNNIKNSNIMANQKIILPVYKVLDKAGS